MRPILPNADRPFSTAIGGDVLLAGRHIMRPLAAIALVAALAGPACGAGWRADFAEAQAAATRTDRPLLVHFFAEWCGPCKRMDREFLESADFLAGVGRTVVAVKVDIDHHRDLAVRYGVESIPTDLLLTPDGRVLGTMNGYRTKNDYLRRVAAVGRQYDRLKELYLARSDGKSPVGNSTNGAGPQFPAPEAIEPGRSPAGPRIKPPADGTVLVGLKGHSPVALARDRKWVKGDPRFAWEHQGLTYLMASADELAEFQRQAERYAPRLLGCDPVVYVEESRAVPGSTRYAAYFEERLYLFSSAESRSKFREEPTRYTRRQTVLLIEELSETLR